MVAGPISEENCAWHTTVVVKISLDLIVLLFPQRRTHLTPQVPTIFQISMLQRQKHFEAHIPVSTQVVASVLRVPVVQFVDSRANIIFFSKNLSYRQ
jgi:hypothetical protein